MCPHRRAHHPREHSALIVKNTTKTGQINGFKVQGSSAPHTGTFLNPHHGDHGDLN